MVPRMVGCGSADVFDFEVFEGWIWLFLLMIRVMMVIGKNRSVFCRKTICGTLLTKKKIFIIKDHQGFQYFFFFYFQGN